MSCRASPNPSARSETSEANSELRASLVGESYPVPLSQPRLWWVTERYPDEPRSADPSSRQLGRNRRRGSQAALPVGIN